ncbi:hypothetical protein YC2023_073511 [Brassica napus]
MNLKRGFADADAPRKIRRKVVKGNNGKENDGVEQCRFSCELLKKSPPLSSSSSNLLHSLENPVNFNQKLLKLFEIVICRIGFGINIKGGKLENTYDQVIVQNISGVGMERRETGLREYQLSQQHTKGILMIRYATETTQRYLNNAACATFSFKRGFKM